jgi:hypothetical protein
MLLSPFWKNLSLEILKFYLVSRKFLWQDNAETDNLHSCSIALPTGWWKSRNIPPISKTRSENSFVSWGFIRPALFDGPPSVPVATFGQASRVLAGLDSPPVAEWLCRNMIALDHNTSNTFQLQPPQ